jgi:hypothetical protein
MMVVREPKILHEQSDAIKAQRALQFLLPLSHAYPGISHWFVNKVTPYIGISRCLVMIERHGEIVALGIAKNEEREKKLCTIRVAPDYEGRGMGLRVMDNLMQWLNTDLPLATVNEEKMPAFERVFCSYGFCLTSVVNGLYREGKLEFFFNEPAGLLMQSRQDP